MSTQTSTELRGPPWPQVAGKVILWGVPALLALALYSAGYPAGLAWSCLGSGCADGRGRRAGW